MKLPSCGRWSVCHGFFFIARLIRALVFFVIFYWKGWGCTGLPACYFCLPFSGVFFFFFFVRETLRAESFQGSHLLTLLINPWLSCKTRQCFARCRKIPCKTKALTIPDWLWVERNFRHNMWHSKFTCLIIQCVCVGERKRDNSFSVSF